MLVFAVYIFYDCLGMPDSRFLRKGRALAQIGRGLRSAGEPKRWEKKKTAVDRYKSAAVLFLFVLFIAQGIKNYTFKVTDSSNK